MSLRDRDLRSGMILWDRQLATTTREIRKPLEHETSGAYTARGRSSSGGDPYLVAQRFAALSLLRGYRLWS